ncbi:MAG: uroporphyrinogen decarboxylase family protein [Prevotella intermedia]
MSIAYLSMQAEAGANALQIFDSWVGAVNAA